MNEVIEALKMMGATNIVFVESKNDYDNDALIFEFNGDRVEIYSQWCNNGTAALGGSVSDINNPIL